MGNRPMLQARHAVPVQRVQIVAYGVDGDFPCDRSDAAADDCRRHIDFAVLQPYRTPNVVYVEPRPWQRAVLLPRQMANDRDFLPEFIEDDSSCKGLVV